MTSRRFAGMAPASAATSATVAVGRSGECSWPAPFTVHGLRPTTPSATAVEQSWWSNLYAFAAVAGDEDASLRVIAMGQRNAGVGGASGRCGDARANLERNAVLGELFDLFAAATEDERVAALEPHHALALARQPHQQVADLLLRQRVVGAPLADIDALGLAPREVDDAGVDQPVVEHDVGLLHQPERAEGQQVGVARSGADEIDLAERRRSAVFGGALERRGERLLGRRLIARQHQLGNRPVERAFPETPPRDRRFELVVDLGAGAAGEGGEAAVGGGDQCFEPRAQQAAEQRRRATGRNRDDQRRAVEDRRRDEVAEVGAVGDADRNAGAGERGVKPLVVGGIAGRDIANERASEIGALRLARFNVMAASTRAPPATSWAFRSRSRPRSWWPSWSLSRSHPST